MKNPRAIMMIVLSVVVGLISVILASQWVAQQAEVPTSKVLVAKADINMGARLSPDMIAVQDWPEGSVPAGAMMAKDQGGLLKDPKTNEGRVVRSSILKGEPILESKLAPAGAQPGLSFAIKEGMRAITVRVNDVVGVAGFALPGNYVDIMVNTVDEQNQNKTVSKIVLEHILLLAIAQETSQGEGKPKVVNAVTLEVTPDQAEKIDLARSVGTLSLVLRNQLDTAPVATEGVYQKDLLRDKKTKAETPAAATTSKASTAKPASVSKRASTPRKTVAKEGQVQVEVIQGNTRSVEVFDLPPGESK